MDLQKRLDLTESYIRYREVSQRKAAGMEYTITPGAKIKPGPVKIIPRPEVRRHGKETSGR